MQEENNKRLSQIICSSSDKYDNYSNNQISENDKMTEDELREMLNEMIGREPGTYKYCESSWSKKKLIDFILTCHGSSVPKDLGVKVFVGGGWTL
jgi:hypothetical protein